VVLTNMTEPKSSRDQLREWIAQLAAEHRRELMEILAEDQQLVQETRYELAVEQLRRLSAVRGVNWETMSSSAREQFLDQLLREDIAATNIGPPPSAINSAPAVCHSCGRDLTPADLYRIYFSHRHPSAQRVAAYLVIVGKDSLDAHFPLASSGETVIGRLDPHRGIRPDSDLSRHDQASRVSRRHARILARDDQYFVEDLGSSNGTFLNGRVRLSPQSPLQLNPGDTIRIGQTVLKFTTK
jgi:hypothetical protein